MFVGFNYSYVNRHQSFVAALFIFYLTLIQNKELDRMNIAHVIPLIIS